MSARHVVFGIGLLFALSPVFPIVASVPSLRPGAIWFGLSDVGVALILGGASIAAGLFTVECDRDSAKKSVDAYRIAANLALILLVLYLAFRDVLLWDVLLPGLAWRFWLLAQVLPAAIRLCREPAG